MSFLINPYAFGGSTFWDDSLVVYSLRRPDMAVLWTNAVAKIRRDSDNATAFLFFDGSDADDTISTSSLISTTSQTTPDATTLATWLGSNDFYYEEWFGITANNVVDSGKKLIQTTTTRQPKGATSGAIITKNSLPTVDFLTDLRNMKIPTSYSALDSTEEFTVISVSHSDASAANGLVWTTSSLSTSYIIMLNDRRALKKAINQLNGGVQISTELTAQVNSANQRILTAVHDGTNNILYYNSTLQNTVAHTSAAYNNDAFRVGSLLATSGLFLNGSIQEVIVYASDKTSELSLIHSDIDTYYSIP